uniref:Integrator complex subunit 10 n=1 Tax=Aceria tosichella TaxID=561515 RepID=A0A6G1S950_9ACAR
MTNLDQKDPTDGQNDGNQRTDVQSYLISRYRDALKSGDKSFAKSCLLSTRLFSVDDPNVTNEIYVMAKADGDISEAAKCFANMFENLFTSAQSADNRTSETLAVANQMKEEIRLLLNELKNQHLKLRSAPTAPSGSQSPLLSPRLRMSSEDRTLCRDSVLRLDKHLNSTNKSLFYQQLFDHLSQDVRRNILNHSVDNCDNPFERCRFMMLSISLFNDNVATHGHRLIRTLIDLSQATKDKSSNDCDKTLGTPRPQSMCQYARRMLILDAIPLIFNLPESLNLEFDLDKLFQQTINYYSEFCLERAAEEYEFEELHEGLKKAIAARILAKDLNFPAHEETIEENLNVSMNLLFDRFLHEFSNDTATIGNLKKLRQLVVGKSGHRSIPFEQISELMAELELENDIPENILFDLGKDDSSSSGQTTAATPPPKSRGRPKKVQPTVIVSPDDGVRRHLQRKAKEALFIFTSILQHMFVNSSIYLRQTRSRIVLSFDNPLARQIETEISKSSSQRSSRTKNLASETTGVSPSKKLKTDHQSSNENIKLSALDTVDDPDKKQEKEDSPLNSEHSKKMDREIVETLREVHKCIVFLKTTSATFEKLFSRFLTTHNSHNLNWFMRVHVDCMIISKDFDSATSLLDKITINQNELNVKKERDPMELSTLTVSTGTSPSVEVYHLRALTQMVSCNIHLLDKDSTLKNIANLLSTIKQSGLIANDENYSTGNVIDEYRVIFADSEEQAMGYLFFDALSILRYIVVVLMDILKRYVTHPNPNSDSMIGHAIVLSQVDWPEQIQTYDSCIAWIRANKPKSTTPQCLSALTKFTYPDFFNYIFDPNILEDFMALLNEGITLDIKNSRQGSTATSPSNSQLNNTSTASSRSSGGSTRSGKAITTRGVNKTFKDDLKVTLIAQMKNSSALVPLDTIADFVQTSLVPYLMSIR